MTQSPAAPSLPPIEDLLLNRSLYDSVPRAGPWTDFLYTLRYDRFQLDAHCIQCEMSTTFKASYQSYKPADRNEAAKPAYFDRAIVCLRNENHSYIYNFRLSASELQKVGQFPSIEDIIGSDLKRYKSVIDWEDFRELRRATGLFSHGIGIGSFVYLRRIFERMIYRHRDMVEAGGTPVADFDKMRMDEKIGALASVLPSTLVRNKAVYSILSTGIHELDEDTCRKYFPAVRAAIIQILEQDLEAKLREKAEQDLAKEIASIHGALKQEQ